MWTYHGSFLLIISKKIDKLIEGKMVVYSPIKRREGGGGGGGLVGAGWVVELVKVLPCKCKSLRAQNEAHL